MKAWTDLSAIQTPPRIAALPKDERGYPIFFTALIEPDGKPNYRVQDTRKCNRALSEGLCGMCGQKLGKMMAFVGGPISIKNRLFADLPMHESCAVYALQACPFIAAPKFSYQPTANAGMGVNPLVSNARPERFGLGITNKMKLVTLHGQTVIKAGRFSRVQFWVSGKPV
ncbi:TPA: hypothetical protein L4R50_000211 [Pseudomonas aeruginosa]|nr:hypothetical protein [Pseudomonas aeruginosa]